MAPQWLWPQVEVAAAFGAGPAEFTLTVSQTSTENGRGLPARRNFTL